MALSSHEKSMTSRHCKGTEKIVMSPEFGRKISGCGLGRGVQWFARESGKIWETSFNVE